MRSEPVNPAQGRSDVSQHDAQKSVTRDPAGADAFEAALRRRGGRPFGDDAEPPQALPDPAAPQGVQAPWPAPALPRVEAPPTRWAPQAAAAPDAVARQLKAQALAEPAGETGRWQLQLTETGLPVQRMELQRAAAGPVTVLVSALTEAQQPRHAARLRERLAARGGARVDFRGPSTEHET